MIDSKIIDYVDSKIKLKSYYSYYPLTEEQLQDPEYLGLLMYYALIDNKIYSNEPFPYEQVGSVIMSDDEMMFNLKQYKLIRDIHIRYCYIGLKRTGFDIGLNKGRKFAKSDYGSAVINNGFEMLNFVGKTFDVITSPIQTTKRNVVAKFRRFRNRLL